MKRAPIISACLALFAAACGGMGRLERMDESLARIDAHAYGLHQELVIVFYWVSGLLLAGLLDRADQMARRYRERCQDTPGAADVSTSFMCGAVAVCAVPFGGLLFPVPLIVIEFAEGSRLEPLLTTPPSSSTWNVTRPIAGP